MFMCSQLLSRALLDCHKEAQKAGQQLSLEVFMAGRNRLEDEGAKALSRLFEVIHYTCASNVYDCAVLLDSGYFGPSMHASKWHQC